MRPSLLLLALCILPAGLSAQGWIEPPERWRGPAVTRVGSTVRATVDGPVVRFEVEEQYRNDGGALAEGTYLFPLPGEAVFTDFSLFQGRQELRGEMLTAEQARGIYEAIVRQKKDPALLTLAGHGLIRAQVFPIQPGETRTVILRFTQRLERSGDALALRYSAGRRGGNPGPVRLTVSIPDPARFGRPYSPTHQLEVTRTGTGVTVTIPRADEGRDVHLLLPLRGQALGASLLTHAPASREDGFFMLLVTPTEVQETAEPRDVTFVVDVSGSMAGEKLAQARSALLQALAQLRAADRLRIIAFASGVRTWRDGWAPADREAVRDARRFVEELTPGGGTNIAGALEEAFAAGRPAGRMSVVLFLTDGQPSVGEKSPETLGALAAAQGRGMRVFPIGVGHDVNTYLLDRLARDARGAVDYVAPGEDVELAVSRTFARVSRPALTDLRLVSSPVPFRELAPATLPDVFAGEELVLTGRYDGSGSGTVVLEGTRNGRRERITVQASFPRHTNGNAYIPSLWAARRIGELTQAIRLEGAQPHLISAIRELGLRYGVLTEYTSYLVQEPQQVAAMERREIPASAPRPEDQVGRKSFNDAQRSGRLRGATTLQEATLRLDEIVVTSVGDEASAPATRRAGQRMLVRRDGVWTDVAARDSVPTVTLREFSEAYFALLRALPELSEALGSGGPVLLGGRQVNLRIGPDGISTWRPGALDRFVQEFRGK